MSLTREEEQYHDKYEVAPGNVTQVIDACAQCIMNTFRSYGFKAMGDDRAEALVAALMKYYEESQKEG